jgi:hypothetical protein
MNSMYFTYGCQDKTFCEPFVQTLGSGIYKFEVWGASGGSDAGKTRGKGGYSKGIISINSETKVYINVGAEGGFLHTSSAPVTGPTRNANGGGGQGRFNKDLHQYLGGGGGSTDIRLLNNSLNNRVIVAGGGGGSGYYGGHSKGGDGGGEIADRGEVSRTNSCNGGIGGGQNSAAGSSFFQGGNHPGGNSNAGGGGGGWFGGAYGQCSAAGGGGGSGFVYTGANSFIDLPINYFLSQTENKKGVNTGDGIAKITKLSTECTAQSHCSVYYIYILTYILLITS